MTIRLTLALLALPLIPFQNPDSLICKQIPPDPISQNNRGACESSGIVCSITFVYLQKNDGNCFDPGDCNWLFNIKADACAGANNGKVCLGFPRDPRHPRVGDQVTVCGDVMGGKAGLIGPGSIILDCDHKSSSLIAITFKNKDGKKIGQCHPKFECKDCPARIKNTSN